MSFRSRLTTFFVVIVIVPMIAFGFLVFRLINDSTQGKADARANGLATAAASLYTAASADGRFDAQTVARAIALTPQRELRRRLDALTSQAGLARVTVAGGSGVDIDVGDATAIAPGIATLTVRGHGPPLTIMASELTAAQYARQLRGSGVEVVIRQGSQTIGSTLGPGVAVPPLPRHGTVTVAGVGYRSVSQSFSGFDPSGVHVTVLSALSATTVSTGTSRIEAAAFIVAFLVLAFLFSVLASRALQGQLSRFLQAARRLASGDFSDPVPIEGKDEFAELGQEFNSMSGQLSRRLDELSEERARLRDSIRRIRQTFASNLDRPALLELALKTAVDGVQASLGRLSSRARGEQPLEEILRVGSLSGLEDRVYEAERAALRNGAMGESSADEVSVLSVALGPTEARGRPLAVITVGRSGRTFSGDDRELLRSLASQATLALENVELHHQVQRQAVTDELTGLANHGRFQEVLGAEVEQVRRYRYPLSLIMLDIDDFKAVNDAYGHQQGDVVLRHVAQVLRDSSRETDAPARYGGEEMALVLPHTDLEGAYAIAERIRSEIEVLRIRRIDGQGTLRITASLGVAVSSDGEKDSLIADADAALYAAKRDGKNRTMKADISTANVFDGK
jgi:diguanylate cyclase (GGDEF)-like protein